jgi:peptidoglycan/LPS O-acetylase OafA/YrhL
MLAPNNGPFWSLNYEAMYYWIFGAWHFLRGWWRWPVVVALVLLAGPRIMVLMPCWLAGVLVYRWQGRIVLPPVVATGLLLASLAAFGAYCAWDVGIAIHQAIRHVVPLYRLRFSLAVVGDYLLTLIVALNFLAVAAGGMPQALLRAAGPIRSAAASTLTVYLFHVPLAFLAAGVLGLGGWALMAAVVLPLAPLSLLTEQRRGAWRRALEDVVPMAWRRPATTP